MRILRLLNKKNFLIIIILFFSLNAFAEDQPVDIWNLEKENIEEKKISEETVINNDSEQITNSETSIYDMQSQKNTDLIKLEKSLEAEKIEIFGLYDPEDYGLDINMWSNSNGNQLKKIFSRLKKIDLSEDATELMNITLLTNAYSPKIDISENEFLNLKSNWLIKNSDLELIEEYLIKNQIINLHPKLTKFLLDQHLAEAKVERACSILSKNLKPIDDNYLTKFNIYCLIKSGKKDEAQLIFDLKKELGFKDKYFEKKNKLFDGI